MRDYSWAGIDGRKWIALPCRVAWISLWLVLVAGGRFAHAGENSVEAQIAAHRTAARAALEGKDYAAYREHVLALKSLLHDQAELSYSLAAAEALLGHPGKAFELLEQYASTGLSHNPASDARFASLNSSPRFAGIQARLQANDSEVSRSQVVVTLPDPDILAEDIAYDPDSRRFFISSVHKRRIFAAGTDGSVRAFGGEDGRVWGVFALAVDRRRHRLWATTAAVPEAEDISAAEKGRTALLCYDLRTEALVRRLDLPEDGSPHALGDMTVGPKGEVYVSDGIGGLVYRVLEGSSTFEAISTAGSFRSPQTPALAPDGRRLFVADYSLGIGVIDLRDKALEWLPHSPDVAAEGTDGLYLWHGSLIAIQNGFSRPRIIAIHLDSRLSQARSFTVLERRSQWLGDPTHGVVVGSSFYFIGNSGWNRMDQDGHLRSGGKEDHPVILRMRLERVWK